MNLKITSSIATLPQNAWDVLVPADFPFMKYDFLHALETGRAVGPRTGWQVSLAQ